ncbi:MAG TPA: hypothetical protein VL126_09150 [Bacteroidota bacterium]|nr:hypothetical protein [Bacteroidota bacterium]
MVAFAACVCLLVADPPFPAGTIPPADTTQSESVHAREKHALKPPPEVYPGPGTFFERRGEIPDSLSAMLRDPTTAASQIDTLLAHYPELRPLILRELLVPSRPFQAGDSTWQQVPLAALLNRFSPMTPFERMGLLAKRSMELENRWLNDRIFLPTVNLIQALLLLLGMGR